MENIKYTDRQINILKILKNQTFSQKNLADMYQGAIMAKNYHENPDSIYQAAHSLRELTDYMTKHLERIGNKDRKDQMRIFIEDFDPLGGLKQDAVIVQWYDLYEYFVRLCHHHDSISPSELFEEKLYQLENVILAIHGPISVPIIELDRLIENENPTAEDLELALSLIKNLSSYEHFFKQLKHSNWLELLEEKSVYNNIPRFGERSIEPLFLLKVVKQKPEKVLEIIKRHSETDHPGAIYNYIKCLTQMPTNSITQMIKPLKKWINSQKNYTPSLYFVLVDLVLKLIQNNKREELFDLINSMFAIKAEILENDENLKKKMDEIFDKRWENGNVEQYGMDSLYQEDLGGEFQEESEVYSYESMLRKFLSDLIEKYPIKSFKLFLKNLNFSINFYLKNKDRNNIDDHSLIWRNKLKEKPTSKTFRNVLIDVAIEIILYLGNNLKERFPEAILELQLYNNLTFRRLEFFAYNNFPELSADFLNKIELKNEHFKTIDENYELFHLFDSFFDRLPDVTQDNYLKYITKGVKKRKKALRKSRWNGNLPKLKKEDIDRYIKHDQIRKLKPIKKYIKQDFLKKLDIDLTEIDKVNLFEDRGVVFGTKSPLSESMIEKFTMEDLKVNLLKYNEEKGFNFDKIGLGRQLEYNVPKRPNEFIMMLNDALNQPKLHKYISFIIAGLNTTLKGDKNLDLNRLFKIFKILLSEDFIIDTEPLFFKEDTSRDIKKRIADFIHENLKIERITIDFRQAVWELIVKLLDEDINKEMEIKKIQGDWMPRTMSLNSVYGIATNTIFAYISWVLNSDPEKYNPEEKKMTKFFPEILEVIENLLIESLYTTRYIIGSNFYYLCHLDLDWVKSKIKVILPHDKEHLDYFEAAWSGFIDYNGIVVTYFELLRPSYLYALNLINKEFRLIPFSKAHFIDQIMILYIKGLEQLNDEDSLIYKFFITASGENRKIAIRNIGTNLKKYKDDEDLEEIKERLKNLLDYRLREVSSENITNYIKELHGFIYWFRNSIFEKEWTINKLLEILRLLNDSFQESYFIPEILEVFAVEYPVQVIECIEIIIKKEIKDGFLISENKYKSMLKNVINSENEEVNQRAFKLINYLLRMNFHNFKDLLTD